MEEKDPIALFWFRRDLRIEDNAGFYHALSSGMKVLPLFIYDINILSGIEDSYDRRLSFIGSAVERLNKRLHDAGSSLLVIHDTPIRAIKEVISSRNIRAVYANSDYEPYAVERDDSVAQLLSHSGIPFYRSGDQVIFEKDDILKADGKPYTVFTPYSRAWKRMLREEMLEPYPSDNLLGNLLKEVNPEPPGLTNPGFRKRDFLWREPDINHDLIRNYHLTRDFPALEGTTRLGAHLRFGTVSIRKLVKVAVKLNEVWLNELIWREFFMSIIYHFPYSAWNSFRREYDRTGWINNEEQFDRWCRGLTGYAMVDAGMRELNSTGFMHNRARMITAGFLTKHLLIDWRWGESYFAARLLDYELSSNVGNWQWAAGCGCDAVPWFRIFNPVLQMAKYDSAMVYVKRWVPEYGTAEYPSMIIDHSFARERAVSALKRVLNER